jgi:NAD(P)-dependent dehydrogenase (short-subunit alcohol dehydrogenase family)
MIKDQVFMVSGASRGIGYSVARMAAEQGAKLAICSRTEANLAHASREIKGETGADILMVAADLRNIEGTALFIQKTFDHYGRVDALVNCAGDARNGDPLTLPDSAWSSAWELKVFGYVRLSLGVLKQMRDRAYGRIVNVIGYGGRQPTPLGLPAAMANAALLSFTKGLSQYCADRNVLVNAVNPGTIRTDRWYANRDVRAKAAGITPEAYETAHLGRMFMKRIGEPDEVASAVIFLASPQASYITGAYLDVDGGETRCI